MAPPSLLFINRVYPPAEGATGQLLAELAPALARRGWQVTVLAACAGRGPAAPQTPEGIRLEWVRCRPLNRASHFRRALGYLALYPKLLWRAGRLPRPDVVVTMTDPPLQLLLGLALQWRRRSRHVHWAQDLYPEVAEEMHVLPRNGLAARVLRALSTLALRRADRVLVIGRCMQERLQGRGIPAHAIEVIPNWAPDSGAISAPDSPGKTVRQEQGWEDKFVVMYAGNLGLAHPFQAMLDAAERWQAALPRILLVFVGNGPRLASVQELVRKRSLLNVRFLPFQPKEKLGQTLAAADLHLASMRPELCGLVVPSKVYGILAAARPCVFLGPESCEAARLIQQHQVGSVLPDATGAHLAACVSQWLNEPERLRNARERASAIAGELRLPPALQAFQNVLEDLSTAPSAALLYPVEPKPPPARTAA